MRGIGIGAAALLLGGCGSDDMCGNQVAARAAAPDGLHNALLFQRDCGATTGFSTQISIVGREEVRGAGNVFIADDGQDGSVRTGSWGGPWAELRWLAPGHLLVRYAAGARILHKEATVAGVNVSYEAVAQTPPAAH